MSSIQAYRFQLDQVKASLALDPENEKLKALAQKLQSMIDLTTKSLEPVPVVEAIEPRKLIQMEIGQACEAKEDGGSWSDATIQSISADKKSCTVIFTGGKAQHCLPNQIRPAKAVAPVAPAAVIVEAPKPVAAAPVGSGPVRRKHTKQEHAQKKEAEQREKQSNWQNFSKKMLKPKESIFSTANSSKIGVINSGRPPTEPPRPIRHVYKRPS